MLITLPGSDMVASLRNRLLSSNATITAFSLGVLLALVSTVAVCCKGGTLLISGTICLVVRLVGSTFIHFFIQFEGEATSHCFDRF